MTVKKYLYCGKRAAFWLCVVFDEKKRIWATSLSLSKEHAVKSARRLFRGYARFRRSNCGEELLEDFWRVLNGERIYMNVCIDYLSEFARRCLEFVGSIPRGYVTTYLELARKFRSSPRAIGRVLSINPLPVIIPCHRVVTSRYEIGGYSLGSDIKAILLKLEASRPEPYRDIGVKLIPAANLFKPFKLTLPTA